MKKDYMNCIDCEIYKISGTSEKTGKDYEFYKLEIEIDGERFQIEPKGKKELFNYLLKKEAENVYQ